MTCKICASLAGATQLLYHNNSMPRDNLNNMTVISKPSMQSKHLTLVNTEPFASGHESRDGQVWLTFRYWHSGFAPLQRALTHIPGHAEQGGIASNEDDPLTRCIAMHKLTAAVLLCI